MYRPLKIDDRCETMLLYTLAQNTDAIVVCELHRGFALQCFHFSLHVPTHQLTEFIIINPRCACAARITVLGLSFCLSVCLSVTTFSAATRNKTANK